MPLNNLSEKGQSYPYRYGLLAINLALPAESYP